MDRKLLENYPGAEALGWLEDTILATPDTIRCGRVDGFYPAFEYCQNECQRFGSCDTYGWAGDEYKVLTGEAWLCKNCGESHNYGEHEEGSCPKCGQKLYRVPITWKLSGDVIVRAAGRREALRRVDNLEFDISRFTSGGNFVKGSIQADGGPEELNGVTEEITDLELMHAALRALNESPRLKISHPAFEDSYALAAALSGRIRKAGG